MTVSRHPFAALDQTVVEALAAEGSFTVRQLAREVLKLRDDLKIQPPSGVPLSYVTNAGVVLVPPHIRAQLGLMDGGGVVFITADDGTVKMLNDDQLRALLGED